MTREARIATAAFAFVVFTINSAVNVLATLIVQWVIASTLGTRPPFFPLFVALMVLPFAIGSTRLSFTRKEKA